MMLATLHLGGTVATGLTVAIAMGTFIVGVFLPSRDRSKAARIVIEQKAAELELKTALRNQRIDQRIEDLVSVTAGHDRRISRLERRVPQ